LEQIKSALREDGVVFLKGALTDLETQKLRSGEAELDELHRTGAAEIRDARFFKGAWPPALADVERWPTIALVTDLIGEDVALYHRRFLIKDPIFSGSITPHQEMPYFHGGLHKLNVFLAVSPNTAANGHLRYYAGSHKYGLIGQGDIQPERFPGVRDVGEDLYPGDLVLMDHCTWHHSADSTSPGPRYLLQLIFQPADDGSSFGEEAVLVSGQWRTELRFPGSEALTFYNVRKYVDENKLLRAQVEETSAKIDRLETERAASFSSITLPLDQKVFALTSWGYAGIPWITKCLNLHPDIQAFLNVRSPLNHGSAGLSATEYLKTLANISSPEPVCGDVNGISPHEFAELGVSFGEAFRGAHLTGPPILRFAGSLAYSRDVGRHWDHQTFLDLWSIERGTPLSTTLLEILGEDGDHVPAHYMMHVNGIAHLVGTAPLFRIDRLMVDDEEWLHLVKCISSGTIVDYGSTWQRLRGEIIGSAHEPFRPLAPKAKRRSSWFGGKFEAATSEIDASSSVWRGFPDQVRRVVAGMLNAEAREQYAALGYDLAFVPQGALRVN
jgi:hypothetical protein